MEYRASECFFLCRNLHSLLDGLFRSVEPLYGVFFFPANLASRGLDLLEESICSWVGMETVQLLALVFLLSCI